MGASKTSLDLLCAAANIELKDLDPKREQRRSMAASNLAGVDYSELGDEVSGLYKSQAIPVYAEDELVPRMYPVQSKVYRFTDDLLPETVSDYDIQSALLYAHKVEVPDPLHWAISWAGAHQKIFPTQHADFRLKVLLMHIDKWGAHKPLIDSGIISYVSWGGGDRDATGNQINSTVARSLGSREFRRLLIEEMPDLAYRYDESTDDFTFPELSAPEEGIVLRKSRNNEMNLVGPAKESKAKGQVRIEVLKRVLSETSESASHWPQYVDDIKWFMGVAMTSRADHWIPSKKHLRLVNLLANPMLSEPEQAPILTLLGEFPFPSARDMKPADLIAIRKNSDALEGWRECVRLTYAELNRKLSNGALEKEARDAARDVLGQSSESLLAQLSKDLRKSTTGALRGLALGAAGATPGMINGDSLLVAGEGLAAGLLANLAISRVGNIGNRAARNAVRKHVAITSEGPDFYHPIDLERIGGL